MQTLLLLLLLAGPVEDQARDAVKSATAAYNLGRYDEAIAEYERAYRLIPDPPLLFNIAQAQRRSGLGEKAIDSYKAFLRTTAPDDPNRALARKHLDELELFFKPVAPTAPKPAPKPPKPAGLDLAPPPEAPTPTTTPVYKKWWFWTGLGVAVVTGAVTAIAVASSSHNGVKAPPTALGNQRL